MAGAAADLLDQAEAVDHRVAALDHRGEADAKATAIYATAYGRDASFYAFTKSLETYERTMDPNTVFILGTDSEFLRFLETPR
mgnify:CR=1 FL=1